MYTLVGFGDSDDSDAEEPPSQRRAASGDKQSTLTSAQTPAAASLWGVQSPPSFSPSALMSIQKPSWSGALQESTKKRSLDAQFGDDANAALAVTDAEELVHLERAMHSGAVEEHGGSDAGWAADDDGWEQELSEKEGSSGEEED